MNKLQKELNTLLVLLEQHGTKINETETCLGYQVKTYRLNNVLYIVTLNRDIVVDISRYE